MKSKECTKCGRVLPLSAFGNHRLTKDKKAYQCKECAKTHAKSWNKTASGVYSRILARTKHWKYKPVKITREEFTLWYDAQPRKCVYCDIPEEKISLLGGFYGRRSSRLCIDCIDNECGYITNNLVLCCYRCNMIKSDVFSFNEMMKIGHEYLKPKWMNQER